MLYGGKRLTEFCYVEYYPKRSRIFGSLHNHQLPRKHIVKGVRDGYCCSVAQVSGSSSSYGCFYGAGMPDDICPFEQGNKVFDFPHLSCGGLFLHWHHVSEHARDRYGHGGLIFHLFPRRLSWSSLEKYAWAKCRGFETSLCQFGIRGLIDGPPQVLRHLRATLLDYVYA